MQLTYHAPLASTLLAVLGLAASIPVCAQGNPIYVTSGGGIVSSQFGVLNPTTGTYTFIGTTSEHISGLGFGANGDLYGLGYDPANKNYDGLYAINPATAALTFIGDTEIAGRVGIGFGATSDGILYEYGDNILYRINPSDAKATTAGSFGFDTYGALNGDDHGNLYLTGSVNDDNFYQVNRTTGQATLIGSPNYGYVSALADTGGTLYAINYDSGSIFSINTTTAAITQTATYDTTIAGRINAATAQFAPVPEASSVISLGLLFLLGLGGVAVSHRYKGQSVM